jgi:quinol monooxygenase YgiN
MKIIMKRKLKDYDAWKKIVTDFDGMRREYGSRGATVYRSANDPSEVYLVFDWDDSKPYANYLNLPEVKKALAETGTTEVIEVGESFDLEE